MNIIFDNEFFFEIECDICMELWFYMLFISIFGKF